MKFAKTNPAHRSTIQLPQPATSTPPTPRSQRLLQRMPRSADHPNSSYRVRMIISRTPLRISIGGGGTDLPSYYSRFGGALISSAIDKYVFIGINKTFSPGY